MPSPHGGKIINRILEEKEKKNVLAKTRDFKSLVLDKEQIKDIKNIARGVYSPLTGPLRKEDFESVVSKMRLKDGTVWTIPLVLDVSKKEYNTLKKESAILLTDEKNKPIAILEDPDFYPNQKEFFAKNVFGTTDKKHPGVEDVFQMKDFLLGGDIKLLDDSREPFPQFNFTPEETRRIFEEKKWETVAAFQTRNVPHRGHEFLQKCALRRTDGLFVQPVIGEKKLEDFKDEYILASYEVLLDKYYPKNRALLGILPLKMRYAGPREAVFHALVRKNYGCTHFIVGRDHAGAGKFYPPFAAQEIFDRFGKEEIGIELLKYPEVLYCPSGQNHVFKDECPHEDRIRFSGSQLRSFIKNKKQPPTYLIRPEVYGFLTNSYNSLVDQMYKKPNHKNQKGFVLWFTGLSQSGKTSNADKVYEVLKNKGIKVERLDGDIVRKHLSKDLGFTKEDRDENIRRVRFVSKLLSQNEVGVIASFISPYREERKKIRQEVKNFIEVFCNCPLESCEKRDSKGLYQKARKGEIKNFTGISDPYEEPKSPEIVLDTKNNTIQENAQKVINFLKKEGYIT